ncbi:hypothetical protein BDW69DRAFT_177453 [Aspergillus filifer]
MSVESVRECMKGSPFEEDIVKSILTFPNRLQEFAIRGKISTKYNAGPFPLYHPDLYVSNIIIDYEWDILGVIDWEGACTVSWEVVEQPLFVSNMPRAFDDPENYDYEGRPKDADKRKRVEERKEYVGFVREIEEELGG